MDRVAVLGIGNVLMGDDAAGPWLVRILEAAYVFPEGVGLTEVGTPGHDLALFLEDREAVIVVDAVKADGSPGEVRVFREEDLLAQPSSLVLSPHEPGLREALGRLRFAGRGPGRLDLVGIIPARVEPGIGLSPSVRAALPAAERAVVRLLADLGVPARPRPARRPPDVWWER